MRTQPEYSEQDYYEMIDDGLAWPIDRVASVREWKRFRTAFLRWLAEQDQEHREAFDQSAVEREHDEE